MLSAKKRVHLGGKFPAKKRIRIDEQPRTQSNSSHCNGMNDQCDQEDYHFPMQQRLEIHISPSMIPSKEGQELCQQRSFSSELTVTNQSEFTPSFSALPDELLFNILSFVGPVCSSLLSLAQLTKYHSSVMQKVSEAMLSRARSQFRHMLPKYHPLESSTSLFVRHAQYCRNIHYKMERLETILRKEFVPVDATCFLSRDGGNSSSTESHHFPQNVDISGRTDAQRRLITIIQIIMTRYDGKNIITTQEVDTAVELASCLLGNVQTTAPPLSKTTETAEIPAALKSAQDNILHHVPTSFKLRLLTLCGKCGGKVFKYAKLRLRLRNIGVAFTSNQRKGSDPCSRYITEFVALLLSDSGSTGCKKGIDFQSADLIPDIIARSKDQERMDNAQMIMKNVISRKFE